ncbi:hypothetical protein OO015_09830 [Thermomicrobium sp. 4228-Ro]|uniref:hypothetical protein n=1 Tax=Thermomicrobium sp. 4228-Ro TaxID=2993937 RepID=UPI0022497FC2|nr:hypothetical protein [Thermomicrobium sp. 4228-Ro]MCX2727785.1 hypothetical protein [Thermomicrobium sp. 4228-Ro]
MLPFQCENQQAGRLILMQVCYDSTTDQLELTLEIASDNTPTGPTFDRPLTTAVSCILDVADEGRLLGIELALEQVSAPLRALLAPLIGDDFYVEVERTASPRVVRSVTAPATVSWQPASSHIIVSIPRRTCDYELLFPSGAT